MKQDEEEKYLKHSGFMERIRERYFLKILGKLALPAEARILDYGCGRGDFILAARKQGRNLPEGVDTSDYSIRLAAKEGVGVRKASVEDLLGEQTRYDAIVVQSVLEHVPNGPDFVDNLTMLLKPGGMLVLSAPTPGPYFWDDPTHVRPYTPQAFTLLAEMAGLELRYNGYVFGFLLGFECRSPFIFPLMNIFPLSLGSNLIAFMAKEGGPI